MFQTLSTPLLSAVFTNATRLNGSGGKRRFSVISSCRASSSSSSSSGSDENSFSASAMVSSVATARQRRPLPTAATAGQIITLINSSITSKFHRVTRKTW